MNPNLLPMFGGVTKSETQIEADSSFIAEATRIAGGREKAAEEFVKKGWQAFLGKRDPETAMMRFNQAWLLDPQNPGVYWGFGVVSGAMRNIDKSVEMLRKAAEMLPDNARLLVDLGFSLTILSGGMSEENSAKTAMAEALTCFGRAEKLEPGYEPLYSNWAVALFLRRDYAGAWEKVAKAQRLGGSTLSRKFLQDLAAQFPRPAQ